MPPPQGFSLGCDGSERRFALAPRRASSVAVHAPLGPAPTMATSYVWRPMSECEARSGGPAASRVIHYTSMLHVDEARFTVGVFQDVSWAEKRTRGAGPGRYAAGVAEHHRRRTPREIAALIQRVLGGAGESVQLERRRQRARPRPADRGAARTQSRLDDLGPVRHHAARRVTKATMVGFSRC